eukprot:2062829-Amphidinium_carterae.1
MRQQKKYQQKLSNYELNGAQDTQRLQHNGFRMRVPCSMCKQSKKMLIGRSLLKVLGLYLLGRGSTTMPTTQERTI